MTWVTMRSLKHLKEQKELIIEIIEKRKCKNSRCMCISHAPVLYNIRIKASPPYHFEGRTLKKGSETIGYLEYSSDIGHPGVFLEKIR